MLQRTGEGQSIRQVEGRQGRSLLSSGELIGQILTVRGTGNSVGPVAFEVGSHRA